MNTTESNDIQPLISNKVLKVFNDIYTSMIEKISSDYKIDEKELKENYKLESSKIAVEMGIKKRNRRVLPDCDRCMGR